MTNSSLYLNHVTHTRFYPKRYSFPFSFFWFYLDLDELSQIKKPLFGYNKFSLFSFWDKDHLPIGEKDLRSAVQKILNDNGVEEKAKSIKLLTNTKTFGYVFNPVSFYFIETENQNRYCLIEICNTYFEVKPYLTPAFEPDKKTIKVEVDKNFYISPFSAMRDKMVFHIKWPDEKLKVDIHTYDTENRHILTTSLSGQREKWQKFSLLKHFFNYPLLTFRIIASIHWHALILFLKKIPYYKKSDQADFQKGFVKWK